MPTSYFFGFPSCCLLLLTQPVSMSHPCFLSSLTSSLTLSLCRSHAHALFNFSIASYIITALLFISFFFSFSPSVHLYLMAISLFHGVSLSLPLSLLLHVPVMLFDASSDEPTLLRTRVFFCVHSTQTWPPLLYLLLSWTCLSGCLSVCWSICLAFSL